MTNKKQPRQFRWLGRTVLISLLSLFFIYLLSGICVIKPEEEGYVQRFGTLLPTPLLPGTHYHFPYPIDRLTVLRPNQVKNASTEANSMQEDTTYSTTFYAQSTTSNQFLTGDENLVHIAVNVQYKVGNPAHYLFITQKPQRLVRLATEATLTRVVAQKHVDDLLTSGKQWVLTQIKEGTQEYLDQLQVGILIISANFERVTPPLAVADAFKDVASALEDRDRYLNEAEGKYSEEIPQARGEADKLIQQAEADKKSKINQARGRTDRFLSILDEFEKTGRSETVVTRLYLETLEETLPLLRKYFFDSGRSASTP